MQIWCVMASRKCKASAAWLHQEGIGKFYRVGSRSRENARCDLPMGGTFRTSAECVRISVVRSAKWHPPSQGFDLEFHNINQVNKVTPPCDKWVRRHDPGN